MIVKQEMEIAKEFGEVMDLVIAIVKTIKDKGDYTALIPELIAAINGIQEIPEELKDLKAFIGTAGFKVAEIVEIFTEKEDVA